MSNTDIIEVIRNCKFSRIDLEAYAAETGSGRGAIEKDFFISIILIALGEMDEFSEFADKMVFKGGTCIKESVTQTAWRNELGGLLMRPSPLKLHAIV